MKKAILVTAYKDIPSLLNLIDFFDLNFNFYIHIDKKQKFDSSLFCEKENVFLYSKYTVNWGGMNHLKAILFLANEALKNNENDYFHLITGEDFPIKPVSYFLNIDIRKNYLEYFDVPASRWKDENGGLDRLSYYYLYDYTGFINRYRSKLFHDKFLRLQNKIKIRRVFPQSFPPELYGGSTYWSLNREVLQYVIDYTNGNKSFLKRFRFTFCAEEFYFQTLLINSDYAKNITNDNLRFIDWESGKGGYPAFLDEEDFNRLISSPKIFARKIKNSERLRFLLINYFKNNSK